MEMDIENDEENEGKEQEKEIGKIKKNRGVEDKKFEGKKLKIKNKKKITRQMLKNPQSIKSLGDQLQLAANAAIDIYEKINFVLFLKKKIDTAEENDLKNQKKSIVEDYMNTKSLLNNIIKLIDNQ